MVLETWLELPKNEEMTDTEETASTHTEKRELDGRLLVNPEDVYKATWIPSIFIMTAQEVEISVGEQAQAALTQEEEAVTAGACMYCQHQHKPGGKALPILGSLSYWGPWHGCVCIINIYTLRILSVPIQDVPHRGEWKDALEFYK